MKIERTTAGAVTILAFKGEFDAAADASVVERIDRLIEGSSRLIFNFRELKFISSSALGYLLKTVTALRRSGGDLVYSEPAKCFQNIIDVYGLAQMFQVFASDQAALDHFEYGGGDKIH